MTRLLAVETSGRTGGVAAAVVHPARPVGQRAELLSVARVHSPRGHAAELVPAVAEVCRSAGWRPADVDVVGVSVGPGGFTGLRIGVTLAKSLALAVGARVVTVSSAEVAAHNAIDDTPFIAVVLDAKRGDIFAAGFARNGSDGRLERVLPEAVMTPAELLGSPQLGRPLLLVGEGLRVHAASLIAAQVNHAPENQWAPQPQVAARLAADAVSAGHYIEPDTLTPVYLRPPEAQEVWDRRYGPGQSPFPLAESVSA